ncbi:MAG: kelch repeat-containing protein, partial [Mycobacterium sp.]
AGIAVGPGGDIFVAVPADNWVLRVDRSGTITVVAGDREGAVEDYDGDARLAALSAPRGVASDDHGNLFIAESGDGRVRRVDAGGTIRTVVAAGARVLNNPTAVALDRQGGLIVAEPGRDQVVRLPRGATASSFLGPPKPAITQLSPSQGGAGGATSVVIRGTGFSPFGNSVTFGGRPAPVLQFTKDSLLVSSPPFPAGTAVDVIVTTRGGHSSRTVASRFTYETGWAFTGALGTARLQHTATLLASGQVLVAGGSAALCATCAPYASAELYDPTTGEWRPTGSMQTARMEHTATLLPGGRVLAAGGKATSDPAGPATLVNGIASAELYDPATGAWASTGSMTEARFAHTATPLGSGKVLVAGGVTTESGRTPLSSAELYDLATGTWSATGSLGEARGSHTATLLADGRVLVAGGLAGSAAEPGSPQGPLASAELYDPVTRTWTRTGDMAVARYGHTATLLPDGEVLVVGGFGVRGRNDYLQSAELYDPATGRWRPAAIPTAGRAGQTATLLPTGSVLVVGGSPLFLDSFTRPASLATAELYDPAANRWTTTRLLNTGRGVATATLLSGLPCQATSPPSWCGAVLVTGGAATNNSPDLSASPRPLASSELYR